jgi:hypothetical protein
MNSIKHFHISGFLLLLFLSSLYKRRKKKKKLKRVNNQKNYHLDCIPKSIFTFEIYFGSYATKRLLVFEFR